MMQRTRAAVFVGFSLSLLFGVQWSSGAESWSDFSIILKRNVFDPERNRPAPPSAADRERESLPPPAPEAVELRGVFVDGAEALALLAGARPEWQGAVSLAPGAPVGPGVLESYSTLALILDVDGAQVEWPVGTRLVKHDDGWAVDRRLSAEPPATAAGSPAATPSRTADSQAGKTESSDRDAILKRLMERRMKENQQ
jgi:hypothetical protein